MSFSNPYEAPDTDEVGDAPGLRDLADEVVEEETERGSSIRIGPRRAFTQGWIARGGIPVLLSLLALALALAVVSQVSALRWALGATGTYGGLLCVAVMWVVQRLPPIGERDAVELARLRGGYTVELTYEPRLSGTGAERRETADDIAVLWFDGDWLCLEGDRSTIRLHRGDVRSVGHLPAFADAVLFLGTRKLVRLAQPLAGHTAFHCQVREPLHGPGTLLRARRLRRDLKVWHGARGA